MREYLENLNPEIKAYFKILCPYFEEYLFEYINTPEMKRLQKIGISCGADYSCLFDIKTWYSNLEHSIGVALILEKFTHDKKQVLAGLFHDIASPAFKHCIDFMNSDYEKQERAEEIMNNSYKIMYLLKRDNIKLNEINNYKIYPLLDNNTPRLSADRFENNFSSGLYFHRIWSLDKIKEIYSNIIVVKNEDGLDELAFQDKKICEEYICILSKLWPQWVSDKDRISMQFIADMCKSMKKIGYLTIDDLYSLSEQEIIDRILNSKDGYLSENFRKFQKAKDVYRSDIMIEDKYCVKVKSKTRYVDPLVIDNGKARRISEVSDVARRIINGYLNIDKGNYYIYLDFNFEPYKEKVKTLKNN